MVVTSCSWETEPGLCRAWSLCVACTQGTAGGETGSISPLRQTAPPAPAVLQPVPSQSGLGEEENRESILILLHMCPSEHFFASEFTWGCAATIRLVWV